jgi:DNA-binding LytR/AlgR family response regulator
MKKLIPLLLLTLSLHAQTTHRIRAGMNLQDAITNAASGDIYLVEDGVQVANLNKKFIIAGTWYFQGAKAQAFSRIHRRYLVNRAFIASHNECEVFLACGKRLPLARRRRV